MTKLILCVYFVVFVNCHFEGPRSVQELEYPVGNGDSEREGYCDDRTSGECPQEKMRIERNTGYQFAPLDDEENEKRLAECGKLNWPIVPLPTHDLEAAMFAPWVGKITFPGSLDRFHSFVVISKRHIIADGYIEDVEPLSQMFASPNRPTFTIGRCEDPPVDGKCKVKEIDLHPKGYWSYQSVTASVLLFKFGDDIPVPSICLPDSELVKDEEVFIQSRDTKSANMAVHKLFDIHANGWAVHKTDDPEKPFSQVLVKKEHGRFTFAGNWNHYTPNGANGTSNLLMFKSIYPYVGMICETIGACPLPRRVDFKRISAVENDERLRECGRLTHPESNSSTPLSVARDSPWLVSIERSDGLVYTGVVISSRHVLTDWSIFSSLDLDGFMPSYKDRHASIISTALPVTPKSKEVLNFNVTVITCENSECDSWTNETLDAKKIMLVSSLYVILEMGDSLKVTPICLPDGYTLTQKGTVFGQSADAPDRQLYEISNISNILISVNTSGSTGAAPQKLTQKDQDVFRLIGFQIYQTAQQNTPDIVEFRPWSMEEDRICEATGVCSRRITRVGALNAEENERRLKTCGLPSTTSWIVGVTSKPNNPLMHTGVIISPRHVLISAAALNGSTFSQFFVDYQKQQSRLMIASLPDYKFPESTYELKVWLKNCPDSVCQNSVAVKPNKLLIYDASRGNDSLIVLEFDTDLAGVPVCLADEIQLEKDDTVLVQHYEGQKNHKVLSADAVRIRVDSDTTPASTEVLVRKEGNRYVLFGSRVDSLGSFVATSGESHDLCQLTGVCSSSIIRSDQFVELTRLTDDEDRDRSYSCGVPLARVLDAPWLVEIERNGARVSTGVVISQRHVLMDAHAFSGTNIDKLFGFVSRSTNWQLAVVPSSQSLFRFRLRVNMKICQDVICKRFIEETREPSKVLVRRFSANEWMFILEFDQNLPVPPICMPSADLVPNEEVFIQETTFLSEPLKVSKIVSNTVFVNYTNDASLQTLQVLVQENDGRFTIVGNRRETPGNKNIDILTFRRVFPLQKEICTWVGVCAIASIPTREVLPPRRRTDVDEYPKSPEFKDPPFEDYEEPADDVDVEEEEVSSGRAVNLWLIMFLVLLIW